MYQKSLILTCLGTQLVPVSLKQHLQKNIKNGNPPNIVRINFVDQTQMNKGLEGLYLPTVHIRTKI